tara:strand:+ start:1523 stop:2557 length:1035 start_codon:yes stop_codon:yes gene_type:complete
MKQIRKTITVLPSGNHSINFIRSSSDEQIYTDFIVTGTTTLTGNFNINPSGTPSVYTVVDILWNADVIPSTSNVVIFGVAIPNSLLASGNFRVQCFYDALSGMPAPTNGWVVNIIADASSSGDVDSDRLAADSVTTAKIEDDAVTLAKMAPLTKGNLIVGNSSNAPTALDIGVDSKILIGDATAGAGAYVLSGDVTMTKGGVISLAASSVTTAKILDANVTPAKLSASSNKGQFAVQLEFDEAAKIGVIKYQICSTCTIDGIYATVNRVPATDTATVIPKNHGGVAMTGGQIDITTALALGNIISVTPTANNTFTAGEQMTLETSKTTAEACTITVVVCYTVTA